MRACIRSEPASIYGPSSRRCKSACTIALWCTRPRTGRACIVYPSAAACCSTCPQPVLRLMSVYPEMSTKRGRRGRQSGVRQRKHARACARHATTPTLLAVTLARHPAGEGGWGGGGGWFRPMRDGGASALHRRCRPATRHTRHTHHYHTTAGTGAASTRHGSSRRHCTRPPCPLPSAFSDRLFYRVWF